MLATCLHVERTISSLSGYYTGSAWRVVSEDSPYLLKANVGVFPADCLYLTLFKPLSLSFWTAVWACQPSESFQHIAKFYNYCIVNSYRRRSLGLQFKALTSPLNLPAPGRRQPLYFHFRVRRDLCFW